MANYTTLKAAIADVIKTNGANAITGALLQSSLLSMIGSLGAGYQFAGVAMPTTDPGTPDQNVVYLIGTPGTYTNFGGIVVYPGEIGIIHNYIVTGNWLKRIVYTSASPFIIPDGGSTITTFGIKELFLDLTGVPSSPIALYSIIKDNGGTYPYQAAFTLQSASGLVCRMQYTEKPEIMVGDFNGGGVTGKVYLIVDWEQLPTGVSFFQENAGSFPRKNYLSAACYNAAMSPYIQAYRNKVDVAAINDVLTGRTYTLLRPDDTIAASYIKGDKQIVAGPAYMSVQLFQVVQGNVYDVDVPAQDSFTYTGAGFKAGSKPVIDDYLNESFGLSNEDIHIVFTAPSNGWIVVRDRNNDPQVKRIVRDDHIGLKTINGQRISGDGDINTGGGQLANKVIAVFGDSIMQLMTQETMPNLSGTVTLKKYNSADPTVYQESDATVINGIIWLTSSLNNGVPDANSIRLEIVNSNQSTLDAMVWESLKTQLGAADVICLGFGGASIAEKEVGITTEFPLIRDLNEGSPVAYGNTVCLPNEVKMLKRLVDNEIRNTPDCCIIWLGVNGSNKTYTFDEIMQIPYATLADDQTGFVYRCDFWGGLRYGVETLYRNFPYTTIAIVTPLQSQNGDHKIDGSPDNYRGYGALDEIAKDLKTFADRYSCIFIDALHEIGLVNYAYKADTQSGNAQIATGENLGNLIPLFTRDGLHPNERGRFLLRNYLASRISALYFDKSV